MYYESKLGKMYYNITGGGPAIIFLHGWGQDGQAFDDIVSNLPREYMKICIDLLGFGKSSEPYRALNLDDYSQLLNEFIDSLNVKKPIIIGHSFGGRLAIKYYLDTKNAEKLVLVCSAGIKPKRNIKYYYHVYRYKITKKFYQLFRMNNKLENLITLSGSKDYRQATPIMKATLSKVVNEDLKKHLNKIDIKTHLIWGINDQEVPYQDALIFKKLIKDSELITFYQSGHFPYYSEKKKFIKVLTKIIQGGDSIG